MRAFLAIALAALVTLLGATPAWGGTPYTMEGLTPGQVRWVESTFIPLPENITVKQELCPWVPETSCTFDVEQAHRLGEMPGTIFIHPRHARYPFVLAHELGHQFDFQFMSAADREQYAKIVGRPYSPEPFAHDYANCAFDPKFRPRQREVEEGGYVFFRWISTRQHRTLCRHFLRWYVLSASDERPVIGNVA